MADKIKYLADYGGDKEPYILYRCVMDDDYVPKAFEAISYASGKWEKSNEAVKEFFEGGDASGISLEDAKETEENMKRTYNERKSARGE